MANNFEKLVRAQKGGTQVFEFTSKAGKTFQMDMCVCRDDVMVRINGKARGTITIGKSPREWYAASILDRNYLILMYEEANKDESPLSKAWKKAIIENSLEAVKQAQEAHKNLTEQLKGI